MTTYRAIAAAVLTLALVVGCGETTAPTDVSAPRAGGDLPGTLDDLAAGEAAVFIVQYDEQATSGEELAARIMGLGAGARALRELPFVGTLATAAQAEAIAEQPGVVRVTRDEELEYHGGGSAAVGSILAMLERSVPTIQGEEARAKYGVTGSGIGVAILDSGIDGLYQQDVRFPDRTVQNSETTVGHGTHVGGIAGGTARCPRASTPGWPPART